MRWILANKPRDRWKRWYAWFPTDFERGNLKIRVWLEWYSYRDVGTSLYEVRLLDESKWLMVDHRIAD